MKFLLVLFVCFFLWESRAKHTVQHQDGSHNFDPHQVCHGLWSGAIALMVKYLVTGARLSVYEGENVFSSFCLVGEFASGFTQAMKSLRAFSNLKEMTIFIQGPPLSIYQCFQTVTITGKERALQNQHGEEWRQGDCQWLLQEETEGQMCTWDSDFFIRPWVNTHSNSSPLRTYLLSFKSLLPNRYFLICFKKLPRGP